MTGAAKHMPHLYEDLDLKIGDLKSIVRDIASGGIQIKPVEKVDGQNIFFRWDAKTDQVYTARNMSDIVEGGVTPDQFASKWKGHPAESAFMNGFRAIESAVASLSHEELIDIFGEDGSRFANAEIMYTANPNLIVYDNNYIVLHNLQSYDPATKGVQPAHAEDFDRLVSAINGAEVSVSNEIWNIHGPQVVALQEDPGAAEKFSATIDSLIGPLGLSDNSTLGDVFKETLRLSLGDKFQDRVDVEEDVLNCLKDLARGANAKKRIKSLSASAIAALKSVSTAPKDFAEKQAKITLAPIEAAISEFAAGTLKHARSAFIGTEDAHNASIDSMRKRLDTTIGAIGSYTGGDAEQIRAKLSQELDRLGAGSESLSNVEGIVFEYPPGSGKLKKLTGSFASLNQIIGALGRKISPKSESHKKSLSLMSIFFG